jgi:NitT/TauT family transport system substrate-binding protein
MDTEAKGRGFSAQRRGMLQAAGAGALSLAIPGARVFAQGSKLGDAGYGVASIDPLYSMAYVAMKKGYFTQAGLDVTYLNAQSGPRAKQMLAAQQLFAATSGVNDSIALTMAGKPSVLVAGFDERIAFANILVSKKLYDSGVRSVKDLAGHSIGITQPQSATWLMAVFLADRAGIRDKVQIKPLGDFSTMLGAVKSGSIDCCTATFSMLNKAQQEGWGVPLFDITDAKAWSQVFGGDVPGIGVYVLQETIDKRPEQVQAFVTGIVKASDYIAQTNASDIVGLIGPDYLQGYETAQSVEAVTAFKQIWSKDNLITPAHYDRLMHIMGGGRQLSDADIKSLPYEKVINMHFVRQARGIA